MTTDTTATAPQTNKPTYVRVGVGLYQYTLKSGATRFKASIKHRDRYVRKMGLPTISKARQWRQSRKGCIADSRLFPEEATKREVTRRQQAMTLAAYVDTWMNAKRAAGLKYTSLKRYASIVKIQLLPAFGSLPLTDVNRAKVRELVAALSDQGLQPNTIKSVLLCLSAIYSDAIEDGYVQHNPALKTGKLIKTSKTGEDVSAFTHDEERRALATAKERCPHYYPFILLLFRTGLREGEAVALRPEDLDMRQRYLWVQRNFTAGQLSHTPKSRQKRRVDLAQDLVTVLQDYSVVREAEALLQGQPVDGWLFTTPRGAIIRSNNFRDRVWKPLLKAAGLPYRWIHATRHTYATRMIMGGANLVYVQKQLGHSSIQITVDTYTHWIQQSERDSVLEVDRLMGQPDGDGCTFSCTKEGVSQDDVDSKREKVG